MAIREVVTCNVDVLQPAVGRPNVGALGTAAAAGGSAAYPIVVPFSLAPARCESVVFVLQLPRDAADVGRSRLVSLPALGIKTR
jgi:hypothetical protein